MPPSPEDKNKQEAKPSREGNKRLDSNKQPTESLLKHKGWVKEIKDNLAALTTKPNHLLGPFFRERAPYRAKLSLPHEEGEVIVIKGRVWSYEDNVPLPATLDVWQTNSSGHYDNEVPGVPAEEQVFINRACVKCDEYGRYEFETVRPGAYKRRGVQHAAHIHIRVRYANYVDCVTQILFSDDEYLDQDPYWECSAIVELKKETRNGKEYKEGVFDFVLGLGEAVLEDDDAAGGPPRPPNRLPDS